MLRQLDAEGLSYKAMGRRLGCTEETIRRQRGHCGLPNRPQSAVINPNPQHHRRVRVPKGASTLPQLASLAGDGT